MDDKSSKPKTKHMRYREAILSMKRKLRDLLSEEWLYNVINMVDVIIQDMFKKTKKEDVFKMDKKSENLQPAIRISGGKALSGSVKPSGFKHSAATIISFSILFQDKVVLHNVPNIKDVFVLTEILSHSYNAKIMFWNGTLTIDNRSVRPIDFVDYDVVSSVHGTLYLIPMLAARFGGINFYAAGGCPIGDAKDHARPNRHVLQTIKRFGAQMEKGQIRVDKLAGITIDTEEFRLNERAGVTKTALMYGVISEGTTRIRNYYFSKDVVELIEFLISAGADIRIENNDLIVIGSNKFMNVEFTLSSDLIEVVTFVAVAAVTKSVIEIEMDYNTALAELKTEFDYFKEMGLMFTETEKGFFVIPPKGKMKPLNYAEFRPNYGYSDSHQLISAMALYANGKSTFKDRVWANRVGHIEQFSKLGAEIIRHPNGEITLQPGDVHQTPNVLECCDVRVSSSNVIAALGINGTTYITKYHHIYRGYEKFFEKLKQLGADIKEVMI